MSFNHEICICLSLNLSETEQLRQTSQTLIMSSIIRLGTDFATDLPVASPSQITVPVIRKNPHSPNVKSRPIPFLVMLAARLPNAH